MTEFPWASPAAIGALTISQVMALGSDKPPGTPTPIRSGEEFERAMARLAAEARADEAAWFGRRR